MFNTRAYEFHDFIFYKAIFKYSFFNSESHVLWTYAVFRFAIEINRDNLWTLYIIGTTEQLFYKLWTAFANRHSTKCTVPSMAIGTEDHFATTCHCFTHVLVNNSKMRRYIDAAKSLHCRQAKYMVVFVNCAPYSG